METIFFLAEKEIQSPDGIQKQALLCHSHMCSSVLAQCGHTGDASHTPLVLRGLLTRRGAKCTVDLPSRACVLIREVNEVGVSVPCGVRTAPRVVLPKCPVCM